MVGGVLVAGCAQVGQEGTVTPDPSSSASSEIPHLTPGPDQSTKIDTSDVIVTGVVERVDIEGGCTALRVDANKRYELKGGDPAILKAGARVTVRGKIRSDLVTICQMGPVLEVISSQPA